MVNKVVAAMLPLLFVAGVCFGTGQSESTPGAEAPIEYEVVSFGPTVSWPANDAPDGDPVMKIIEERFNVRINYSRPAGYPQAIRLRIAAGDFPDWYMIRFYEDYKALYEDGLLHHVSDYLDRNSLPNLEAWLERDPALQVLKEDDGWWAVPWWSGPMTHSLFVRQDLLDKAGFSFPANVGLDGRAPTMDEFADMLRRVVEADPDGTRPTGYIGPTGGSIWYRHLMVSFVGFYGWGTQNGAVTHWAATPGYRDALRFLARLYADGLLDPEVATTNPTTMQDTVVRGRAVAWTSHTERGRTVDSFVEPIKRQFPDSEVRILPWPAGPNGPALLGRVPFVGQHGYAPDLAEESVLRILQITDWLMSDEGIDLGWYGMEGVHHTVQNGQRVRQEGAITSDWGQATHPFALFVQGLWPAFQREPDPEYAAALQFNAKYQMVNPLAVWAKSDRVKDLEARVDEVISPWWFNFVTGVNSLDSDWDTYLAELRNAGLPELTELAAAELSRRGR